MQTVLEAQENLATLLEQARRDGAIRIRRDNGQTFVLQSEKSSPLDVESVQLNLSADEIVGLVREGRERS